MSTAGIPKGDSRLKQCTVSCWGILNLECNGAMFSCTSLKSALTLTPPPPDIKISPCCMSKVLLRFSLFILEFFWSFKETSVYLLVQRLKQNKTIFCSHESHCGIWNRGCFTSDHAGFICVCYLFPLYLYIWHWTFAQQIVISLNTMNTNSFPYIYCS